MLEKAIETHAAAIEHLAAAIEKYAEAAAARPIEGKPVSTEPKEKPESIKVKGKPAEPSPAPKAEKKVEPEPEPKAEQAEKPAAEQKSYALPAGMSFDEARQQLYHKLAEALKFASANSPKRLEQLKEFCLEYGIRNPKLLPDDKVAEFWCRLRDEIKIDLEK